jgi:ribonucleoside-diphosphate reductase beta chain
LTAISNAEALLPDLSEPADLVPGVALPASELRSLLDPGLDLTLRPMRYPDFYERYRDAIRNTWTVEEVDWTDDLVDLRQRLLPAERHLIRRLVAFFATGDSIVANNLVLNLYKHLNSPEARLFLSRQLFEEAQHVQFYLTLLDTYVPDLDERAEAFAAIEHIPSIRAKAEFCFRWMDGIGKLDRLETFEDRRTFLLNIICFAACIEGLFFFAAFAYVYFLRSKGLLNGLASGTNWVFRDESGHMDFAFAVVDTIRAEEPALFNVEFAKQVTTMIEEAVEVELAFAADVLADGVSGIALAQMREYLQYVADQRLSRLGLAKRFGSKNPLDFMALQDVAEHTNFFERTVSAYQVAVEGAVSFDETF